MYSIWMDEHGNGEMLGQSVEDEEGEGKEWGKGRVDAAEMGEWIMRKRGGRRGENEKEEIQEIGR
jgi:hypothetical protein